MTAPDMFALGGRQDSMTADEEAVRLVDEALKGGISFMFDENGVPLRWQALSDVDPGPSEAWSRLLVEFDRYRHAIRKELRRRLPRNGEILMGTPLVEDDGAPMITKEAVERAWARRHEPLAR